MTRQMVATMYNNDTNLILAYKQSLFCSKSASEDKQENKLKY